MTDLAIYNAPVPDRMRYAEALSGASLLPDSYRGKPANLLLALEYGGALGIAPMVAVQEIHVIKGKPTLSALLQAALVRRAGHKLRVTGDHTTATCQIIRADDPDFTFETTWTLDRAKAAGLLTNDSWRKYPDNMLKARAISECVRNACPDVIAGFGYTPEEMGDDTVDPYPTDNGAPATLAETRSESEAEAGSIPAVSPGAPLPDIEDAVVVDETTGEVTPAGVDRGEAVAPAGPGSDDPLLDEAKADVREQARRRMWGALRDAHGQDDDAIRAAIAEALGREVQSTATLTVEEMQTVRAFVNRGNARRVSR